MKKIDDLYFGIKYWDFNNKCLRDANLFDCSRVRQMVANYIIDKSNKRLTDWQKNEPMMYMFGDLWSRCEWELVVNGLTEDDNEAAKIDIFNLYVKPNERLLLNMIDEVSVRSAQMWRKKNK